VLLPDALTGRGHITTQIVSDKYGIDSKVIKINMPSKTMANSIGVTEEAPMIVRLDA
jgi:hypothetical protein